MKRRLKYQNIFGRGSEIFVREKIGYGAMADVYEGVLESGQLCAIKIARFDVLSETIRERFMREAYICCSLNHPNMVHGFGGGICDRGEPFYVLQLLRGGTLAKEMRGCKADVFLQEMSTFAVNSPVRARFEESSPVRTGFEENPPPRVKFKVNTPPRFKTSQLSAVRALNIARDIAKALTYLQEDGRVLAHRDIKPSNIMFDLTGEAKLIDFGVARTRVTIDKKLQTRSAGTLRYMSPEQLGECSEVDIRSDIYSLGVILFEMLTGQSPWKKEGKTFARTSATLPPLSDFLSGDMSGDIDGNTSGDIGGNIADKTTGDIKMTNNIKGKMICNTNGTTSDKMVCGINSNMSCEMRKKIEHILKQACAPLPYERYQRARDFADDLSKVINAFQKSNPKTDINKPQCFKNENLKEAHHICALSH